MNKSPERRIRNIVIALIAIVAISVIFGFIWPLAQIQFRLRRNGAYAAQIVESLKTRFPEAKIRGVPLYDIEVIVIFADDLAPERRPEVEQCLRTFKADHKIAPIIRLRFFAEDGDHERNL